MIIIKKENIILEQDIINTYNKRQQEQCRLYREYNKIKKENPIYGYKKIAKLLGHPYGKTRWWHAKKHIPVPIQTMNWLQEKGLIPLNTDHLNLPLIAKILGTTFSDGGIFQNLNAIFLSSSELETVKEFGEGLKIIFGKEIENNSRIIEGGEYGHSWCYQNTNRNIIRFFQALGAPIGRKSETKLNIPKWIFLDEKLADGFIGSIFGGDGGIPKYVFKNPNPIDIGITGREYLRENRIEFLEQIRKYFIMKGIETNKLYISKWKNTNIFRLPLRSTLSNFLNFYDNVPINYCNYKKLKLENTIKKWKQTINNERFDYIKF